MATAPQLAANRANSQLSTGPTSPTGKAATSQNAVKHSLASKNLIIPPGHQAAFTELEAGLRTQLSPTGALEEVLFRRILECSWKLERCRIAECEIHNGATYDPLTSDRAADYYTVISRYAREAENSLYKALRELGKLQSEKQYRREAFPLTQAQAEDPAEYAQTPHAISPVCSLGQVLKNLVLYLKHKPAPDYGNEAQLLEMASRHESPNKANRPKAQAAAA